MMSLTAKQQSAVSRAPQHARAKLAQSYKVQNGRKVGANVPKQVQPHAAKPKGKARAKGQPSLREIYSPWTGHPTPVAVQEGNCVAVDNKSISQVLTTINNTIICIGNTGHSATCAVTVYNTATPVITSHDGTFLTDSSSAGGPVSGRAMKCGVSIRADRKSVV